MPEEERLEATAEEIEAITKWLKEQPHLPDKMS
jgi:hypothetical protein